MCGIAGYMGSTLLEGTRIEKTLQIMKNRGPDCQDYRIFNDNLNFVALLHSRLSIIDLDRRSNQPFTLNDCTITYNGEIYNYVELRKYLEQEEIFCATESDTEVLLRYYIRYGEECIKYFEGMWAFAIYDNREKKLFLSRDRFAEKPLYYFQGPDGFYFASEIKMLQTLSEVKFDINYNHILRYLVNGYKSLYKTDETFYQRVHEVPFATNLVINKNCAPKIYRYWQPQCEIKNNLSLDDAITGVRNSLIESMRIRLRSDVPLAFCLSGGVDSASLASIASKEFGYKVVTFSIIDSDERYNEYDNIMATVRDLECEHILIETSQEDFFERLEGLIKYHDSPISTISYYVHSFLSEAIAKSNFRVAISGTAADELLTGYYDHFNLHLYEVRNHEDYHEYLDAWKTYIGPLVRNPYLQNPELYFDNPQMREHIYLNNDVFADFLRLEFKEKFTENNYSDSFLKNRMLNELFHESIPVILHEDDLNSMFYSIENRSPYLDSRLFAFAYYSQWIW
jgi:asparagine synthase (glutamine-hydrolysing)